MTVIDPPSPIGSVPVVDLSAPEEESAKLIQQAGLSHGFFYVKNHGVAEEVIEKHLEASKEFFKLPLEVKLKQTGRDYQGYFGLGHGNLDEHGAKTKLELREHYIIHADAAESPEEPRAQVPFHYPNTLPSESELPGFKKDIDLYMAEQTKVMNKINRVIAISLGLPPEFFDDKFDDAVRKVMLIHYYADVSDVNQGLVGVSGHRDFGTSTILYTDGTPGLQVLYDGVWFDVPSIPGTFIVNMADLLHRWTNGRYKSALHRVNKLVNTERYSSAFFVNPNFDTVVDCLPTCLEEGEEPKFSPVTTEDYYKMRLAASSKDLPDAKEVMGSKCALVV